MPGPAAYRRVVNIGMVRHLQHIAACAANPSVELVPNPACLGEETSALLLRGLRSSAIVTGTEPMPCGVPIASTKIGRGANSARPAVPHCRSFVAIAALPTRRGSGSAAGGAGPFLQVAFQPKRHGL